MCLIDTPIDFAFNPRLSQEMPLRLIYKQKNIWLIWL